MTGDLLKKKAAGRYRSWIQFFFFIFVAFIATTHGLKERGISVPFAGEASLHAVCPFGGVVSFWNLAMLGTLVRKAHESSVVLAVIGILLAILFGPVLCGWVCPFGTFQEWVGKLGRKLTGKRYNTFVPVKLDRVLRYFRYFVFIWVSYMTVISGKLVFEEVDPYYALFNFWTGEVAVSGFIALGAVAVLSLVVERPFCKYFCPYGAFLGIFNGFRLFSVRRNPETCISCNACNRVCPMNITVTAGSTVRNHQCISCLKCSSEMNCPVAETVEFSAVKRKFVLGLPALGFLTVAVLFGGIGLSALLGSWNVSSSHTIVTASGAAKSALEPEDIRGSFTWDEIATSFDIPVSLLVEAFQAESAGDKVKTLETRYGETVPEGMEIGTDSVRWFVALLKGLPYEAEQNTLLPQSALPVLTEYAKASPEQVQEAVSRTNSVFKP